MSDLRLGLIGASEGNGHPYSWGAILNGYDHREMATSGYPAISTYLSARSFPDDMIKGAEVTHVWTQDRHLSKKIAKATHINYVVDSYLDMIGHVDAVLLARDDAESHQEIAAPFLASGLPIYIDKPLAYSVEEASAILDRQQYSGQVFSCSALRFAKEFSLTDQEKERVGPIKCIHATVPKNWEKYAIHVIEPCMLLNEDDRGALLFGERFGSANGTTVAVEYASGFTLIVSAISSGVVPFSIRVFGEYGWTDMIWEDAFSCFKAALTAFIDSITLSREHISREFMLEVVGVVELGIVN